MNSARDAGAQSFPKSKGVVARRDFLKRASSAVPFFATAPAAVARALAGETSHPRQEPAPTTVSMPGWAVNFRLSERFTIYADPRRYFHCPALIQAPNGDWLTAFQDALNHPGKDGYTSQARSIDGGKTWTYDGIVADERLAGISAMSPQYGITEDGQVILVVGRRSKEALDYNNPEAFLNATYYLSRDNGRTYKCEGFLDPSRPRGYFVGTSAIRRRGKTLYCPGLCLEGLALYVSDNNARTWTRRSLMAETCDTEADMFYPTILFRPDGTMICQGEMDKDMSNWMATSPDDGRTWSKMRRLDKVRGFHPDMAYLNGVLVTFARDNFHFRVLMYFSPDHGETWSDPVEIERTPEQGGYVVVMPTKDKSLLIVFSSSWPGAGNPAIRGVFLQNVTLAKT
jgi:hypothetical protein